MASEATGACREEGVARSRACRAGVARVVQRRAFAVMSLEVAQRLARPLWRTVEALSCLAHAHDYALLLKVPCAGSGGPWVDEVDALSGLRSKFHPLSTRAAYMPLSGRHHALLNRSFGVGVTSRSACERGGQHCGIQDLLLVDMRMAELRTLIALGNAECGTTFPSDVAVLWDDAPHGEAAPAALAAFRSPAPMSMVGESEHLRPVLWQDPRPSTPRPATRLPDGTYACRLANSPSHAAAAQGNASEVPVCQV